MSDPAAQTTGRESAVPRFVKHERDPEHTRATLERWFAVRLGTPVVIEDVRTPSGAGVSNETFLCRARWQDGGTFFEQDFAIRLHPTPDYQVFYDPQFREQYDLLTALHVTTDIPVPRVYCYESDPGPFGRPFFVMERVRGRVPLSMPLYTREGFLVEATIEQRQRAWEGAIEQLAAIHSVPVSAVAFLNRPVWGGTALEQELTYWEHAAHWGLGEHYPAELNEMLAWLRANIPVERDEGLSWGDARLGNLMFDDDFNVAAVLDWEQASLVGPTADLAWWLFFDEMYSVSQGIPRLEGMGGREATLELWSRLTGREPQALRWHEVFVGFKMANLAIRTTVVLPSARGAAPALTLSIVNGALAQLDLGPLEKL